MVDTKNLDEMTLSIRRAEKLLQKLGMFGEVTFGKLLFGPPTEEGSKWQILHAESGKPILECNIREKIESYPDLVGLLTACENEATKHYAGLAPLVKATNDSLSKIEERFGIVAKEEGKKILVRKKL